MNAYIARLTALALLLAATSVSAETPAAYADPLQRCVAALRTEMQDDQTHTLRYTVSRAEKQGAWYEFRILTEVFHTAGAPAVHTRNATCRAHRWADDTRLAG